MTKDNALREWDTKQRKMGCVSATNWFCSRTQGYVSKRLHRYDDSGEYSHDHVVAHNPNTGDIVDLAKYADIADESCPKRISPKRIRA